MEIKTISGVTTTTDKCRKMSGEYYLIGDNKKFESGDCYFVEGKYRRLSTGYITWDYYTKQYVLKSSYDLKTIIVDIKDNDYKQGDYSGEVDMLPEFSANRLKYKALNKDILLNAGYRFNLRTGLYKNAKKIKARNFDILEEVDRNYKNSLSYDSIGHLKAYSNYFDKNNSIKSEIDDPKNKIFHTIDKMTKGLSFGFEFETVKGNIPQNSCKNMGLIPLRDGSIGGIEYATIPHSGVKGLLALKDITKQLSLNTEYDNSCSLHLHLGGIPRTEGFILALFRVLAHYENDIFELFPVYKKYNLGVKRKHYTKPLPCIDILGQMDRKIDSKNIKENFNPLFKYLSMGYEYSNYNNNLDDVNNHPSDPRGNSKWYIRTRYHWVNFIPLIFGNKKTIEFRIHTPTTDLDKVFFYLLFCASLVNFSKNNTKKILTEPGFLSKRDITDIMVEECRTGCSEGDKIIRQLCNYIGDRKYFFSNRFRKGDIQGDEKLFKTSRNNVFSKFKVNNDIVNISTIKFNKTTSSKKPYGNIERLNNLMNDDRIVFQQPPVMRGGMDDIAVPGIPLDLNLDLELDGDE